MNQQLRTFLRYTIVPIIALLVLAIYLLIVWAFDLPNFEELVGIAKFYYQKHPYWTTLIAALAEGFLLLNWYLPGSVVLAFGVVFASTGSANPMIVVALIMVGFLMTAIANYLLGRYGLYKIFLKLGLKTSLEKMHTKVEKYGLPIILSSYFHPNIGALAATSSGILKLNFLEFISYCAVSIIFWNTLFGTIVYFAGESIVKLLSTQGMLIVMSIWLIVGVFMYVRAHLIRRSP